MAFVSAVTGDDSTKKFMDVLQNDFKTLSLETKKKYPQIREVSILQLSNNKQIQISVFIFNKFKLNNRSKSTFSSILFQTFFSLAILVSLIMQLLKLRNKK